MRNLKYFLVDDFLHKAILNQLDFIIEFLQEKVKNRVFVKLESRYADYSPEYSIYFGIAFILLNYIYVMTKSGRLFAYKLKDWLLEAGFIQSQCQMSIYYKYAPAWTWFFSYIMLMIVSIDIRMKLSENGLWTL